VSIWKVPIDGGTPAPVSRLNEGAADGYLSISPDGKWLAYHHISAGQKLRDEHTTRIGALPADGSLEPKLFDLPMRRPITQWSADSAAFDYASGPYNSSSLWRQPLNGAEPQKLFDFPDRVFNFAWSQDRKKLVVSRGAQFGDALSITNLP
jgi:Tol biopolymer transport system component